MGKNAWTEPAWKFFYGKNPPSFLFFHVFPKNHDTLESSPPRRDWLIFLAIIPLC
jgi:hypothetical protein